MMERNVCIFIVHFPLDDSVWSMEYYFTLNFSALVFLLAYKCTYNHISLELEVHQVSYCMTDVLSPNEKKSHLNSHDD